MAKVYLPEHFKNEDAIALRLGMSLGLPSAVYIGSDEKGFWVEVPDEGRDAWEYAIREFFKISN